MKYVRDNKVDFDRCDCTGYSWRCCKL